MNKINIERHSDGSYLVTMPDGGQRHCMSDEDVARSLAQEESKYQSVIDNIKARREEFEMKAGNP